MLKHIFCLTQLQKTKCWRHVHASCHSPGCTTTAIMMKTLEMNSSADVDHATCTSLASLLVTALFSSPQFLTPQAPLRFNLSLLPELATVIRLGWLLIVLPAGSSKSWLTVTYLDFTSPLLFTTSLWVGRVSVVKAYNASAVEDQVSSQRCSGILKVWVMGHFLHFLPLALYPHRSFQYLGPYIEQVPLGMHWKNRVKLSILFYRYVTHTQIK